MSDGSDSDAPSPSTSPLRRLAQRVLRRMRTPKHKHLQKQPAIITFESAAPVPVDPIEVEHGITILQAVSRVDLELSHYCGGMASCGTCRVEITSGADNLDPPDGRERMVLGHENAEHGDRLACQARIRGPVTVRIPEWF